MTVVSQTNNSNVERTEAGRLSAIPKIETLKGLRQDRAVSQTNNRNVERTETGPSSIRSDQQ